MSESITSEDAYAVLSAYYEESESSITKGLKRKIKTTATANAFAGKNKKEQKVIDELDKLMK